MATVATVAIATIDGQPHRYYPGRGTSAHPKYSMRLTRKPTDQKYIDRILRLLEEEKVYLSYYGNHAGQGSALSVDEYHALKSRGKLFNLDVIDQIRHVIREWIVHDDDNFVSAHELKHYMESFLHTHCSNGDCTMAMLLEGYGCKWRDNRRHTNKPSNVVLEFRAHIARW